MGAQFQSPRRRILLRDDVLSDSYLPQTLVGLEEQTGKLRMCLSPLRRKDRPLNAWLYGPAGTGKTVLIRTAAKELEQAAPTCRIFHIDCWEKRSLYAVVQALAETLKLLGADAQDTGIKISKIRRAVGEEPMVVVLDNIDRVVPSEREGILYTLLEFPCAGLICISRRQEAFLSMEERVRSRLNPVQIEFLPYRSKALREILAERANEALAPDTCSSRVLAAIASQAHGDARAAIHSVRTAAVSAESRDRNRITVANLHSARVDKSQIENPAGRDLPEHADLVYRLARENQPIRTTDLWLLYGKRCSARRLTPVAERTFSKYVKSLVDAGLIRTSDRCFGGGGRLLSVQAQ